MNTNCLLNSISTTNTELNLKCFVVSYVILMELSRALINGWMINNYPSH